MGDYINIELWRKALEVDCEKQPLWKLVATIGDYHLSGIGRLELYDNGHETVVHLGGSSQPCLFTQDTRFNLEFGRAV